MITKTCIYCDREFVVGNYRNDTAVCCSRSCYDLYRHEKLRKNVCECCKSEFIKENNPQRQYKFCSIDCKAKYYSDKAQIEKVCPECEEVFFVTKRDINQKCCSYDCANKHKDQGKTSEAVRLRRGLEYRLWRESVFERDDYTCVFCGVRGGKLNADHIKRWSDYPELRFAIDNGRTLCEDCHRKTDTYGNRKLEQSSTWDCVVTQDEA